MKWKWPIRKRVIVQMTSGDAISGLLEGTRGDVMRIVDATLHLEGSTQRLDGTQYVGRENVAWIQEP